MTNAKRDSHARTIGERALRPETGDTTVGAGKRPKVESVQAVVERTVEAATAGEFDLNQFLDDGAAALSAGLA